MEKCILIKDKNSQVLETRFESSASFSLHDLKQVFNPSGTQWVINLCLMLVKKKKEGRKKDQVAPVSVSGQINFSHSHFLTYKRT